MRVAGSARRNQILRILTLLLSGQSQHIRFHRKDIGRSIATIYSIDPGVPMACHALQPTGDMTWENCKSIHWPLRERVR